MHNYINEGCHIDNSLCNSSVLSSLFNNLIDKLLDLSIHWILLFLVSHFPFKVVINITFVSRKFKKIKKNLTFHFYMLFLLINLFHY
jgi:hypothetical protein